MSGSSGSSRPKASGLSPLQMGQVGSPAGGGNLSSSQPGTPTSASLITSASSPASVAMAQRLLYKKTIIDVWSTKEKFYLAWAVVDTGDQNWVSVSRQLKQAFINEEERPGDWFSQKNCALQYNKLLLLEKLVVL